MILLLLLLQELPVAEPAAVGLDPAALGKIEGAVAPMIQKRQTAGAVVGVLRRGKVAYLRAFGKPDVKQEAALKTDAIFRIYSMTKPITTVGAMMLVEEGKLSLDDPVGKHLPELADVKVYAGGKAPDWKLAEPARAVTVRDLMRHTSGITYGFYGLTMVDAAYRSADLLNPQKDLAEMVRELSKLPLLHQPGAEFTYGMSVDVLGRIIEVVSGKTLDAYLRERIFEPLEMKDTDFWVPADKRGRMTTNYGPDLKAIDAPATSIFAAKPKLLSGGGGLQSTARDYLRFCAMLLGGGQLNGKRLLKAETVAMMHTNQLAKEAMPVKVGIGRMEGVGFGLGFAVRVSGEGARIGEVNWGGAASTHFWISPADELAVVALEQYMPFTARLETAVKPVVYAALKP